jgi:NADPH-dependent ferric siderophore reductase
MADQPARRQRPTVRLRVIRTEQLTPHMIRVVLGGAGFADFAPSGFTDQYVKLQFPPPGADYPEPFDLDTIRRVVPRELWPTARSYTVRAYDLDAAELTIDFVHHGDVGVAGPWAAGAKPGDPLTLLGPGGAYAPSPDADWHLLAGDESALPAIGASLAVMPAGVPVRAIIQVANKAEEQPLDTPADAEISWLHRDADSGADVGAAVRSLDFLPGSVHAFVHGEAGFVMPLRRFLVADRGVPAELLSLSGYWRRGRTDEQWRMDKAEMRRREEAEETTARA